MNTEIIKLANLSPADYEKAIEKAAKLIKEGEIVAFPTETVYGLGANGLNSNACEKIYTAKGRPSDNPLILHTCDSFMLESVVSSITLDARRLIDAFTPGPLTLVLPKNDTVPSTITGGLDTVAVRIPGHKVALDLIQKASIPIAAPSANTSGRPSPTNADMVKNDLEGKVPLLLDGGNTEYGLESTIIRLLSDEVQILRSGYITAEDIRNILPHAHITEAADQNVSKFGVTKPRQNIKANTKAQINPPSGKSISSALNMASSEQLAPLAPGMKYRHYAPKAPLSLVELTTDTSHADLEQMFIQAITKEHLAKKKIGIIGSNELLISLREPLAKLNISPKYCYDYGRFDEPHEIARNLYKSLAYFDNITVDIIIAEGVRDEGIGRAIMNRLRKAAGYGS